VTRSSLVVGINGHSPFYFWSQVDINHICRLEVLVRINARGVIRTVFFLPSESRRKESYRGGAGRSHVSIAAHRARGPQACTHVLLLYDGTKLGLLEGAFGAEIGRASVGQRRFRAAAALWAAGVGPSPRSWRWVGSLGCHPFLPRAYPVCADEIGTMWFG
jgi:hypothetical protein